MDKFVLDGDDCSQVVNLLNVRDCETQPRAGMNPK